PGTPERETSVAQLIHRVVDTIADWGKAGGYFKTAQDAENFRDELAHLTLTQKACFNSPVWFNVGVKEARGYGWYYDEADGNIEKFIWCKAKEEKKAHTLVDAGYDSSVDGEAYGSVFFQNANNSVRASDDFMQAVVEDKEWWTRSVATGQPHRRLKAREVMRQI